MQRHDSLCSTLSLHFVFNDERIEIHLQSLQVIASVVPWTLNNEFIKLTISRIKFNNLVMTILVA